LDETDYLHKILAKKIEGEKKYQMLFNSIDEGFCIIEMIFDEDNKPVDYRLLEVNNAYEKQTGLYEAEGKTVSEIVPELEEHWFEIYGEIALTGKSKRFENRAAALNKYYDVYAFKIGGHESRKVAVLFKDISDHKKTEESLKESKHRYRKLFSSMTEMFQIIELIYDENGKAVDYYYRDVNPAFERLVGKPKDRLVDKRVKDIFGIVEDYWLEIYDKVAKTGTPARYENYGAELEKYYDIHAWKVNEKQVAIIFTDITDHKKAEKELKKSEEKYRSIGELVPFGVWTTDAQGQATYISPSFCKLVGRSMDDIIKLGWIDTLHPDDRELTIIDWTKNVEKGEFWDYTHQVMGVNGKYHYVLARGVPLKEKNGEITGWAGVNIDITKQKLMEEKLKESRDALEEQVEERTAEIEEAYQIVKENESKLKETIVELERSNAELQSFAYITSHDLQEPLRTIASFSQLLEKRYKDKLDSDADEFIEYIVNASVRMKQMIQGLLDYSRIDSAGKEFIKTDMNINVEKAVSNLEFVINESNAEITSDYLPTVNADPDQIVRVFQNLISNAIKYRKSQLPLRIHISVRTDKERNEHVFSVNDNGIGMEEQYTDKIFEVFKRLHTTEEYEGTGIGLAVVKRIIERHNGHIWVESQLGKCSTFYFSIPLKNK
jgi:PAS domain S-box-containing protein